MEYDEKYYEVIIFTDFHRVNESFENDNKYYKTLNMFNYNKLYFANTFDGDILELYSGLTFKKEIVDGNVRYINDEVGIYICEPLYEINAKDFANGVNNLKCEDVTEFFNRLIKINKKTSKKLRRSI